MKSGCTSKKESKGRSIPLPVLKNSASGESGIAHSQTSRWRAVMLIALTLLMVAHFVQWRIMGRTISPIEPSETMYTLQNGAINAGFIFFTLAIIATLIFGRFICGWGCHILALQDLCAWLMVKFGIKPKAFRSRLLVFVPLIAALYMFVWPTVVRFFAKPPNEPLIPEFTNHLVTSDFWVTFPPLAVAIPFLFICGFMTVYFLGSKGFCTYGCPYGGFFSLADNVAPGKIRVTDACNQCGHCTATCTSNVLVHAEVKQYGMVVDSGCMKCMDCISVCPNDALYFGFGIPALGKNLTSSSGASKTKSPSTYKRNYSLSWPEEAAAAIVFLVSYLAVWDVYQLVPMLMALGVAGVTTFLVVKTWRLAISQDLSFHTFNLKSQGTIKKAGLAFAAFAIVWLGLIAQSGWVRYHERAGSIAFKNLKIPDELALAQTDPAQWLSPADRQTIEEGKRDYYRATDAGFFRNADAMPKLAWFEYLSGDTEKAVRRLALATEYQQNQARALSLYYRGAILNRMGRYDEALKDLDAALGEREDLILAREERGESLWQLGRRQEAIATWTEAVRRNPNLPVATTFLAGAGDALARPDAIALYEKQANSITPNDPYFIWMLGLRLKNLGMTDRAEKNFNRAIQLDPSFRNRRN